MVYSTEEINQHINAIVHIPYKSLIISCSGYMNNLKVYNIKNLEKVHSINHPYGGLYSGMCPKRDTALCYLGMGIDVNEVW